MSLAVQTPDPETAELWLTFDEFTRLRDRGFYGDPKSRLELVDGRVYRLEPVSMMHFEGSSNLAFTLRLVVRRLGKEKEWVAGGGGILQLSDIRSVLPDGMVVRRAPVVFAQARDCLLAAEYTVTSHHRDLKVKPELYAVADVPEYWVLDRVTERLHVHRAPVNGVYVDVWEPLGREDTIAPLFAPDVAIPVADLL